MRAEDIEQLQLERLQSTLNRAYKNVPFYKKQFDALGVDPSVLGSVEDVQQLPFTTREDLGSNYPYGMFALPLRDIVRISSATGTTPQPLVVGYTKGDLKKRSAITARFLTAGGVLETDVVQIGLNPGLSNWGRALKEGAEEIGASVMPMSHISMSKQLMAMEDYKTSVLLTTPSYAMHMIQVMEATGTKADALALKAVLVAGETLSPEVRNRLESALKIDVTAGYGLSDVTGPGVAYECREKDGLHICEDHFLVEIVNVDQDTPCAPGEQGEVVLTTLTAKACPLVRFRTGDLACKMTRICACGRTLMRMSGIAGHTGEVLTVRGVKVHPAQIGRIIDHIARDFSPRFLIHLYRENYEDMIEIWLEVNDAVFSDEVKILEGMLRRLGEQILEMLGLYITVRLVEAETIDQQLARSGGVLDDR
jgi:phenylacetate-CoA ligase